MVGGPFLRDVFPSGVQTVQAAFGYDLTSDPATWVWTDITTYVQWDPGASIRIGYPNESAGLVPASFSATLGTKAGPATNFLTNNPFGAFWPNVKENVPIRALLNVGAGNSLRFQGYATSFEPVRDAGGALLIVNLLANGIARRIKQGKSAKRSAMWRFNMLADRYPVNTNGGDGGDFGMGRPDYNGTGQGYHAAPVHYWPLEERSGSLQGANVANASYPMTTRETGSLPNFAARTVGQGSEPIPVFNTGNYLLAEFPGVALGADQTGSFPTYKTGCVSWLQHIPALPTADAEIMRILCTGTVGIITLVWQYNAGPPVTPSFRIDMYSNTGALIVSSSVFDDSEAVDVPTWALLRIDEQGSDVVVEFDYATFAASPNDGTIFRGSAFNTVTAAGRNVGTIREIIIANNRTLPDVAIGHVGLYNGGLGALPTTSPRAVLGRRGDTPDWRAVRTSLEDEVPLTIIGTSDIVLGPQKTGGYLDIMAEAVTGDAGLLVDGLGPGMTFICRTQAYSVAPSLTLNAAGGMVPGPLRPGGDDQYRINSYTATNPTGSEATFTKTAGTLGTDQVGTYEDSGDVCVAFDATLYDHAGWRVAQGTVSGLRYPTLSFELAKPATSVRAQDWLNTTVFERIDALALEPGTTMPNRSFLLRGWSERWNSKQWDVTANVTPYDAYGVGVLADVTGTTDEFVLRLADDGVSTLVSGVSAGATSLSVATGATGQLWTSAALTPTYADDIIGLKIVIDGIIISVTAIVGGTSPQAFTVTGATVTKALGVGAKVEAYVPTILGL